MSRRISPRVDSALCVGCGRCVTVCPTDTLAVVDERVTVMSGRCLGCDHCASACPEGALAVGDLDERLSRFETFDLDRRWLPHGELEVAPLVRLMASRRSCRSYTAEPVDRALLSDLVKVAVTAPSATSSQRWTFTILPTRAALVALGEKIAGFFSVLNRASEQSSLRLASRLVPGNPLERYRREHQERVAEALAEWRSAGRDRLFHGATAAILVGSRPGGSMPKDDALLATQNVLLAAHAMGLGTCLVGFAVAAIRFDPRLGRALKLGRGERIHAVVALGHPAERYERVAGRLPVETRFLEG